MIYYTIYRLYNIRVLIEVEMETQIPFLILYERYAISDWMIHVSTLNG